MRETLAAINMRPYLFVILITVISSCQEAQQLDLDIPLNDQLMVGEWRVDSSSNRYFSYDKLIILEDSSFYIFSGSNGGSLRTKGKVIEPNSMVTDFGDTLNITLLDSNMICISGGWQNNNDYYRRFGYRDYHESLTDHLRSDSLRRKVLGWWQLTSAKMPIELINYDGVCKDFTLSIQSDGHALFYLENKFDSVVSYSYNVNPDGIDFNRGCIVGSDCKVAFDQEGRMKLLLDPRMGDTLLLERLKDIK